MLWPADPNKAVSLGWLWSSPPFLLPSRESQAMLLSPAVLKTIPLKFFSYLFLFLVVSGESVNLVPIVPSWPEAEISGSMKSVKCM